MSFFRCLLVVSSALGICACQGTASLRPASKAQVSSPHTASISVPQNRFLALNGLSNLHHDSYMSDTYPWSGPLNRSPEVRFKSVRGRNPFRLRDRIGGQCANTVFIRQPGQSSYLLLSMCITAANPKLVLFTPELRELARLELPQRLSMKQGDIAKTSLDTSGVYFYLDDSNRAVVATADRTVKVIEIVHRGDDYALNVQRTFDLAPAIDRFPVPQHAAYPDNPVTGVLPDFEGNLWWVTRYGVIGSLPRGWQEQPEPRVRAFQLRDRDNSIEEIQNTFAVAEDGLYVLSDRAMYRFPHGEVNLKQTALWRWDYRKFRGSRRKPSMYNQGSGTTPTLFDDGEDRFITIADNDEPQMNVWVLRRQDGEPVCATPVFTPWRSATENSLVASSRSVIVSNTYGYNLITDRHHPLEPGVARIDIAPKLAGCRRYPNCEHYPCSESDRTATQACCNIVWENRTVANTALPKLSLEARLLYVYTNHTRKGRRDHVDWFFSALDLDTGNLVYEIPTGGGGFGPLVFGGARAFNNNTSPAALAPDGTAYIGVWYGLLAIRDGGF